MKRSTLIFFAAGALTIESNGFTSPVPIFTKPHLTTNCRQVDRTSNSYHAHEMNSDLIKTLYPASMIGVLGELYFRTRNEMECPRGAVSYHIGISLQHET